MTFPFIKKALKDIVLEAIRIQKQAIKEGKRKGFNPYDHVDLTKLTAEPTASPTPTVTPALTTSLKRGTRVELGKAYESDIVKKLQKFGRIDLPSHQEDAKFKLDGFITFFNNDENKIFSEFIGRRVSIQIKKRVQSGDDIPFEVNLDFDKNTIGRDQEGNSDLYIVSDREHRIGIFRTETVKEIVKNLLDRAINLEYFERNPDELGIVSRYAGAQLRVTKGSETDGREGRRKLMAFIPFGSANPIKVFK